MTTKPEQLSANKQALLKIRELKQQLAAAQSSSGEPVAIVSMACRFPRRSLTPEKFWQCLLDQTDEVSDIPDDRWDLDAFHDDDPEVPGKMYARRGVFLDDLDLMDPEFFGISPREATWVDPQQRLLMEVGWEALERAGWPPEKIGQHTGIFVGWMHNDYQNEASDSFLNLNPYIATGAAGSFLCGRLAYYLGLEGPSVAVDTACSSSLVALHLAILSLQRGDCDRALVGGVNAICSPTTNILTCKLKALSPTGQSRAFDAAADGYLRGEGCGLVTLRRLSDAQQAGDPILGIIRGSAVGHNGFSSGLTAPNPKAQTQVIRQALRQANIDPHQVAYLEAHGTGTELGDPIEMQAAAAALTENRSADQPLLVGSVKTNIGHLEAAAGMAGLIKVLLAIQNNKIPGQMNFETPNPHIPWDQIPVKVLTGPSDWPDPQQRIAGVSAFGMSGTNAHVVIEAPNQPNETETTQVSTSSLESEVTTDNGYVKDKPQLIVLSAKNETALQTLADSYARSISNETSNELADFGYTAAVCRGHHEYRAAVIASDRNEATKNLKTISRAATSENAFQGSRRRAPKVAWQFTGQGSQYVGMSQGLYETESVFRETINHCDKLLRQWRNASLVDVLFQDSSPINYTSWTQPAIFAVQMGLAKLLQSWGLQPDVVLGHSVGQYAAACVAGIMSWDDGLFLIGERGRLIGELPSGGKMLAIFAPVEHIKQTIQSFPDISLAALNGTHVVVSGPADAIQHVETSFADQDVRTKLLATSHAFHSTLMEPALQPFSDTADSVNFEQAQLPLICNVSGKALAPDAQLDGTYWAQHIREAVRFSDGVSTAVELGCEVMLELGPQAVLTRMAAADWQRPQGSLISCLQKDSDDTESILKAVGQLYANGITPEFEAMYAGAPRRRAQLPTYPFQRRRFWGPDKPGAFHSAYHTAHPLLGSPVALAGVESESRFESFIEPDSPPWLPDHEVMGNVVLPGAAFVEMAVACAGSDLIQDIVFEQPLRPTSRTTLQTVVRKTEQNEKSIETFSAAAGNANWTRNFTCRVVADTNRARPDSIDLASLRADLSESTEPTIFYAKMAELGLNYGPKFQTIEALNYSQSEVLTHLRTNGDIRGFHIPPTLLDGALHSLAVGLLHEDDSNLFLPVGIGSVRYFQAVANEIYCHAKWKQNEGQTRSADLVLFTASGQVAAEINDLKVQQVSIAALRQMSGGGAERLVYQIDWQNFRLPEPSSGNKSWLFIHEGTGNPTSLELINRIRDKGHHVIELNLVPESDLNQESEHTFTMCGESHENWVKFFDQHSVDRPYVPSGIAWFFASFDQDKTAAKTEGIGQSTKANCSGLLNLVATLAEREQRQIECGLQLITTDAIAVESENTPCAGQTQYWGLGRVIGAEHPEFRCRLIDMASDQRDDSTAIDSVEEILLTETRDNQFAVRCDQIFVPRLKKMAARKPAQSGFSANPEGSYLITGGLGMLGRQAAKWLSDNGAKQIVLVSRRSPDESTQTILDSIEETGCQIIVHSADLSSRNDIAELFNKFESDLNPLTGLIHAAGVLDDALLEEQTWERFEKVLAPKVIGAQLLHEFTRDLELDFFVIYSSAASVLGSPGQSNYATANAFLDGLAWQRQAMGLPATSINWGPWTEGMADDERIVKRLSLQGITPLAVTEAHSAMERILANETVQATVIDVDWRRMRMGLGGESPPLLEGLTPAKQKSQMGDSELVSQLRRLQGTAQRELLVKTIQQSLQRILSTPDVPETDRPLIEMGLDSLMAVEFGTELQQMLGDQYAVGPTMLFEYPTVDGISDFVLELVTSESPDLSSLDQQETIVKEAPSARVREDVAIIGMSCRFPGARNIGEFWRNLMNQVDSVGEIPTDRWDIDRFYSSEREPGKMYTRQGGFLDDIAEFDAKFFNISDQEACWIDPQHRMLLENSYRALEDAGIPPHPLTDSNVGVFMGIMGQDYAFLPTLDDQDVVRGFQGAGLSHSAGVGRISYVFGFEGPSVAIDTASSSSLVALIQATRSLQDGDCNLALAGGVNAILAPVNSLLMSKAGLLSPDGRCKSFSAAADGFGRGEGCGVVVLKRLSDAQRDGDRIMAVVRGGAVVHNGFSSGITAPSGKSQSRVIGEALKDASIAPSQVQYLEAHGTGTEFGDPMELGAAASVYGKGRKPDQPLLVGSVKANISHLEAAGGVSGLIKTVLALHHGVIPPQAHFEEPSQHIPWKRMPVKVVAKATSWPDCEERLAGVTALGLVGTNAHVVLSHAPSDQFADESAESEPVSNRTSQLLVLSARSDQALKEMAENYRNFILDHPETELADLCYTASAGRRHFEYRVAMTVDSLADANDRLAALVDNSIPNENGKARTNGSAHSNGKSRVTGLVKKVATGAPKIAWLFSGDRDSKLDSIKDLFASEPVFRQFTLELDQRLTEHFTDRSDLKPQLSKWLEDSESKSIPSSDVLLFAWQAGLAKLWQSWGIEPDAVLGLGVGQYTAACLAGGLCFKDAAVLIAERELVLAERPKQSGANGKTAEKAAPADADQSALEKFESLADTFNYYPPNLPLICSLSGQEVPVHRSLGGSYWREHCLAEPLNRDSFETLAQKECDYILEVSPVGFGAGAAEFPELSAKLLSSIQSDQTVTTSLLNTLGQLYVAGVNPDFVNFNEHQRRRRISLPPYPFQKKRYWITEISEHLQEAEPVGSNQ